MNVLHKQSSYSKPYETVFASQHSLYSTHNSTMSYLSFRQELVDQAVFAAERDCTREEQEIFDFLAEDTPPRRPTHQGRRICHYCGERIMARLTEHTLQLDDEQRWHEAAKQHAPSCRWVLTRGVKGGAPDATG